MISRTSEDADPRDVGVDAVSSGGVDPALVSALASQGAASEAAMGMLADVLDMAQQMSAQLVEAMRAASPQGVGGSVDTWG